MKKIILIVMMLTAVQVNADAQFLKKLGQLFEEVVSGKGDTETSIQDSGKSGSSIQSDAELNVNSPLLKGLTFERPKYLITGGAIVRSSASIQSEQTSRMEKDELYGASELINGWYKLGNKKYVKASDVKEVSPDKSLPQKDFNKHVYGANYDMDWWLTWRLSEVQDTGLILALVDRGGFNYMFLGKKIGNLFVFKYRVDVSCYRAVEKEKSFFKVTDEVRDNWRYYDIMFGEDYGVMTDNCDIQIDLSRFTEKSILSLFQEVIQKGEINEYYLDANLLSGKFSNYICD